MTTPMPFAPVAVRGVTVRHRSMISPLCRCASADGGPTDRHSGDSGCSVLGWELSGGCASLLATVLVLMTLLAVPAGGSVANDRLAIRDAHPAGVGPAARIGYRPQRGMFLLATPRLGDPRFARTVVLLLEYDGTGALGLVVNRPTQLSLDDTLVTPPPESAGHFVFSGGPVEHRRLIALLRSPDEVDDAQHVFGDVYASGSMETLRLMLERDDNGADVHAYLGYAGWSPGQLDAEIARGDWIVTPADAASIFDTPPGDVWRNLMRRNAGRWVRAGSTGGARPEAVMFARTRRRVDADRSGHRVPR